METSSSFRFRQLNDYAVAHDYLSGFPNCWEANYDGDVVRGSFLLRNDPIIGIEWRDIPAADLGNPPQDDIGARFRTTNDWCLRNGYYAGFPNFHYATYNGTLVYGTMLFKANPAIQWIDIREGVLRIYDVSIGFRFDAGVTNDQRLRLLRRHSFARDRIRSCNNLNNEEKNNLITAYRKRILHGILNQPNCGTVDNPCNNAEAGIGEDWMNIDFNILFPQGDNEIAQTLIHEMMHSASILPEIRYEHPDRRDCPTPQSTNCDRPGDNGQYYGTPPLRAELCIAGVQSDTFCKYEEVTKSFHISQPEEKDRIKR